jgi:hypothetical protein
LRVTRDKLIDLARQEAVQRAGRGRLTSAFIIGSLIHGEPFLGGSADVDLVLIYEDLQAENRQRIALNDNIHLDISMHPRQAFDPPRPLRLDPFWGPAISQALQVYDPHHFFEYVEAAVRAQYRRPDYMLERSLRALEHARRHHLAAVADHALDHYLDSLLWATNALALMAGRPAAGRRIGLILEDIALQPAWQDLQGEFHRLMGAGQVSRSQIVDWISSWARLFDQSLASPGSFPEACRRAYWLSAFQSFLDAGRGEWVLWPLLTQWHKLISLNDRKVAEQPLELEIWQAARATLLLGEEDLQHRQLELEEFLDHIETLLEDWGRRQGA